MPDPGSTLDGDVRRRMVAFLPRLGRFCRMLAASPEAGEDLMQSTVERALSRIGQWQEGTSLESWMFRIARNLHLDGARAAKVRGTNVPIEDAYDLEGEDGVATVEGRDHLASVGQAFERLPEDQRSLLALVVVDGRSYREASEILDIPIGTVMSRLSRARKALGAGIATGAGLG